MGPTQETVNELYDAEVVDQDGARIGSVERVYLEDGTGEIGWAAVRTGWLGGSVVVPLANAELGEGRVRVPYAEAWVKEAPRVSGGAHLAAEEERALLEHYALHGGPAPVG